MPVSKTSALKAVASPDALSLPQTDDLVADIDAAIALMGGENPDVLAFASGLRNLAAASEPLPWHRGMPALLRVRSLIGMRGRAGLRASNRQRDMLTLWAPRFGRVKLTNSRPPRTTLPDVDGVGVEVPTATLVAAMRAAAGLLPPSIKRTILEYLITVAEDTRTLPQYCGRPAGKTIRERALPGRNGSSGVHSSAEALQEWGAFFHLEEFQTTVTEGKEREFATGVAEAERYVAHLKKTKRLQPAAKNKDRKLRIPSYGAAAEWTGIAVRTMRNSRPAEILKADAAARGVGPIWSGRDPDTEALLKARREELMPYVEECIVKGIPLVSKRDRRRELDVDALILRSGKPGLSLAGDEPFLGMVYRAGGQVTPWTPTLAADFDYDYLLEAAPDARSAQLPAASRKSTKSRTKSAIKLYCDFVGKRDGRARGANRTVGEDFGATRADHEAVLDQMQEDDACGGTPSTFLTAIRWVRVWLMDQLGSDGLGDDFATALRIAVQRCGRTIRKIADEAGLADTNIHAWMRRESWPNAEHRESIPALETALGLAEGRLSDLLTDGGSKAASKVGARKMPKRVRPHAPDNWRKMSDAQFEEFVEYVDAWLLHRSTAAGETSRAAARNRVAEEVRKREIGEDLTGISATLQAELEELVEHMTKPFGTVLRRRPGSTWEEKTTAPMRIARLMDFIKWQMRPTQHGGLGRDASELTLGDFIHPTLVFSYIDHKARVHENVVWNEKKRGKLFTSAEVDFLTLAATLTAKDYGFVTQKLEFAPRITANLGRFPTFAHVDEGGRELKDDEEQDAPLCSDVQIMPPALIGLGEDDYVKQMKIAELSYRQAQADLEIIADSARDPMEPIQPIIDHSDPLLLLMTQLYRGGERQPNKARDALQFHIHRRDTLVNRLFALTALRSTNVRELLFDGPAPNLVWEPFRKQWLLQIHWRRFKNFRSAPLFGRTRHREWYKRYLPDENGLSELISQYVKESRPFLLDRVAKNKKKPDHLFFSSYGNEIAPPQMWKLVFGYTGLHVAHNRYRGTGIPGCQPFGPHAYRDIRATDILLHPCTQDAYLEAANALQTSPAMIAGHYGRVRSEVRNAESDKRFLEVAEKAAAAVRRAA